MFSMPVSFSQANTTHPDEECCICFEPLEQGVAVHASSSQWRWPWKSKKETTYHRFHQTCITSWLTLRPTCPICVEPVSPSHYVSFQPPQPQLQSPQPQLSPATYDDMYNLNGEDLSYWSLAPFTIVIVIRFIWEYFVMNHSYY